MCMKCEDSVLTSWFRQMPRSSTYCGLKNNRECSCNTSLNEKLWKRGQCMGVVLCVKKKWLYTQWFLECCSVCFVHQNIPSQPTRSMSHTYSSRSDAVDFCREGYRVSTYSFQQTFVSSLRSVVFRWRQRLSSVIIYIFRPNPEHLIDGERQSPNIIIANRNWLRVISLWAAAWASTTLLHIVLRKVTGQTVFDFFVWSSSLILCAVQYSQNLVTATFVGCFSKILSYPTQPYWVWHPRHDVDKLVILSLCATHTCTSPNSIHQHVI